jgi:ethanolamine utilization protein EutA
VLDEAELVATLQRSIERIERPPEAVIAVAFAWTRAPEHGELLAVARAIARAVSQPAPRSAPLVVLIDGDVGKTVGHLLRDEVGLACEIISIDGVDLRDFDFVDAGAMVTPPGVIPLVIKSLVFR